MIPRSGSPRDRMFDAGSGDGCVWWGMSLGGW